jgi:hypothetical protein
MESHVMSAALNQFALARALDDCAKWWWGASLTLKALGFATGILIFLPVAQEPLPFLVAAFTILAELTTVRSDSLKGMAQGVRRKLDLQDSFGWEIPSTEFSDLLVRCPQSVKARAQRDNATAPYFASTEPAGPTRALHNMGESAWWTKHLAESMARICTTALVLGVIGALVVLIIALQTLHEHTAQVNTARIVTGFLMLLLSTGLIKLMLGYSSLAKKAGSSEAAACRLLQTQQPEQLDAFRVMYEYHVDRAAALIIPTWIWNLRRNELNHIWATHRATPAVKKAGS